MHDQFLYLSFFNLIEPPFSLVPVPHLFFPSRRHLQILDILKFSILQGSLISVIVGEPGAGKTQALLTLLERLPQERYHKVEILNPALSPEELLRSIFWEMEPLRLTPRGDIEKNARGDIEKNARGDKKEDARGDCPYYVMPSAGEASTEVTKEETPRANNAGKPPLCRPVSYPA